MRSFVLTLAAVMVLAATPSFAQARPSGGKHPATPPAAKTASSGGRHLYETPWSVGVELGFILMETNRIPTFAGFRLPGVAARTIMFNMQIPFEYTFKVGPGELAPHFAFMLSADANFVYIGLPLGLRYKIKVLQNYPFYVWPLLDIGPNFAAKGGDSTSGFLMVGAGLSYLVHKHVEVMFKPLALGAGFNGDGGWFIYNFTLGANFRF